MIIPYAVKDEIGAKIKSKTQNQLEASLDLIHMDVFIDTYNKFGEAKIKYRVSVFHKNPNNSKHLHKFRDTSFNLLDSLRWTLWLPPPRFLALYNLLYV